jgi:3-oxoacyl-[acyl-carrier protein] reductase
MDLRDRVAIVTGGGTGLGRAISHELAGRGCHVAIVYSKSEQEANATAGEVRGMGVRAEPLRADVADGAAVRRMVAETLERFGRLDAVINDAGYTKPCPLSDLDGLDEEAWERTMAVNVKGPWMIAKAARSALAERQGAIVNISSIAGIWPAGSSLAYCVSKAALNHLTRCLAIALAPDVRVNCVAPGLFMTRWTGWMSEETIQNVTNRTPLKRVMTLEDLARMTVELAANDSITGDVTVVDGGLHLT